MPLYALDEHTPTLPAPGRYWIAPGAIVLGRVKLGPDVGVWFGAVLRGDNADITIGQGTNIQDGAVLHNDPDHPLVIGAGCTIGHQAIVHGCTIGDDCLIGMGATILNGATIGSGSLVGAKALVTERRSFPPNSLIVGAPASVKRTLAPEEVERIRDSARQYVANWQRFAAGLKAL